MTSLVGKKHKQTLLCCGLAVNMGSRGQSREVLTVLAIVSDTERLWFRTFCSCHFKWPVVLNLGFLMKSSSTKYSLHCSCVLATLQWLFIWRQTLKTNDHIHVQIKSPCKKRFPSPFKKHHNFWLQWKIWQTQLSPTAEGSAWNSLMPQNHPETLGSRHLTWLSCSFKMGSLCHVCTVAALHTLVPYKSILF